MVKTWYFQFLVKDKNENNKNYIYHKFNICNFEVTHNNNIW